MKRAAVAESNASITTPGRRVVVVGGTQGIGAGIAKRFSKAGAEVWIVGRNEEKANDVLAKLKDFSQEQKIEPPPEHHFIKADLSLISETNRVAEDVRLRASSEGIDYLVMCQGGPPNGTFVPTSEGHESHYAVQVLSRFILAYKLALGQDSVVKKGVMSVMAPGKNWKTVDYDDLDLVKAKELGTYGIFAMASRESVVVDVFTEELAERNPNVVFTHVWPGAVITDGGRNSALPWHILLASKILFAISGTSPESYAEVPFYLLANPEGRPATINEHFWDEHVKKIEPHPGSKERKNRTKIWDYLIEKVGSSPNL